MGARTDTVQAELAFRVGHHRGAVLQIEAHAGDAGLARPLYAVAIAIGEHGAYDKAAITEHAASDAHACNRHVGAEAGRGSRGAIDAITLPCIDRELRTVGKGHRIACCHYTNREHQCRPGAAGRVGNHRCGGGGRHGQARGAQYIFKSGRQGIRDFDVICNTRRAVQHTHRVINEVANFGRRLVDRFRHQKIRRPNSANANQRKVVVDDIGRSAIQQKAQRVERSVRDDRRVGGRHQVRRTAG